MQKISKLTLVVLIALSFNAFGEMHKCVINGKTSYTEKQCPTPANEKAITKGTASVLDTSAVRQQIMEDEIKKQIQKEQQLLLQQQALQQQQILQQQQALQQQQTPKQFHCFGVPGAPEAGMTCREKTQVFKAKK